MTDRGGPNHETGHALSLGIVLLAEGPDWAEFGLDWRPELMALRGSKVPASAPIISLMESACSLAVWSKLDNPTSCLTLSLRVDHLRPAIPGNRLIGRSECFRVTKRIAFARGFAHDGDENDPVANVTASFFYATGE